MNKIDISTEEKRREIYNLFDSFTKKQDIYLYYNISDNTAGKGYIEKIAKEIGFDFNVYKERKQRHCLYCGRLLKPGQKKFCSSSCSAKYFNEGKKLKEETKKKISESLKKRYEEKRKGEPSEIKTCKHCGKILPHRHSKYCCNECRIADTKITAGNEKLVCEYCGKEFVGRHGRKYCCNECCSAAKNEKRVQEWKDGLYTLNPNDTLPESIRNYLFNKVNYKCEECGFEGYNKRTGKTILQIHHIDGNSANNREENLQVLCPNCHAMTDNYMGLNKGKSGRVKRYKKGE